MSMGSGASETLCVIVKSLVLLAKEFQIKIQLRNMQIKLI